jgi:hypothetical protein
MDISSEYIKMCEKAEEIQAMKPHSFFDGGIELERGDYYYNVQSRKTGVQTSSWRNFRNLWLPRQDQLQEMAFDKVTIDCLEGFRLFFIHFQDNFDTMEQLWLAYVMKTKFSKTWNGEEWVA